MTYQQRNIEPHWPTGEVAVVKPAEAEGTYTAERTPIIKAVKSREGYLLIIGELNRAAEVVLVNADGYSAECRPWTDEMEAELADAPQDDRGRFLVEQIAPTHLPEWGKDGSW